MFSKIEGLKLECKGRLALFSFKRKKKVGKVRLLFQRNFARLAQVKINFPNVNQNTQHFTSWLERSPNS